MAAHMIPQTVYAPMPMRPSDVNAVLWDLARPHFECCCIAAAFVHRALHFLE
jgi:hypothetical protein